jgi:serine/threonine-protein kinase HipA
LAGLPAANSEIFVSDKFEVLVSERYDRRKIDGRWARLHQEDTCQALAVAPEMKYQSDGGPSVSDIADLFSKSMTARTREESSARFFEYLFYNVAIGAPDAHAKNFSILLGADDARLAPLYDVASILPYDPGNETKSAMKIGGNWLLSRINGEDWVKTGRQLGLSRDEVIHRTESLRLRIPEALHAAAAESRVPDLLRAPATRIADLVSASLEDKRNQWGEVTP